MLIMQILTCAFLTGIVPSGNILPDRSKYIKKNTKKARGKKRKYKE